MEVPLTLYEGLQAEHSFDVIAVVDECSCG